MRTLRKCASSPRIRSTLPISSIWGRSIRSFSDLIVKGFEYERGRYVVMKDEDFEKVRIESTHSIDITDFVDLGQVDPKFFRSDRKGLRIRARSLCCDEG